MKRSALFMSLIFLFIFSGIVYADLYFPHVDTNYPWETEIAVINTSLDQTLTGILRALDSEGQLISTMEVTLTPHGRKQITIGEEFPDSESICYIIFEAGSESAVGYTKFYIEGQYRAMLPAVSEFNAGDIYISHIISDNNWWTGIGLINTTSAARDLTIEFDNGLTKDITLAPGAHFAFTIRSLFDGEPQPDINSAVIKDAGGIVGLELFGGGNQLSGILLKDNTANVIYYPHIANDSMWWTNIVAYNPSAASCTMTITPYNAEGSSLIPQTFTIEGKGKYVGVFADDNLPVKNYPAGTAWFKVSATQDITGFELFGTHNGNQMAGYTAVGISGKEGVFAKLEKDGWTGIALVNIESSSATVTLTAYDDNGNPIEAEAIILSSHQKMVNTAEDIFFGKDIGNATYIKYSSDKKIVGFQLNGSSDGMMLDGLPGMSSLYNGGISNNEPTATIISPSDGSVHNEGGLIMFSGSGDDAEDGALTGNSLAWTSSMDGEIGTGASFSRNDLSLGSHTITLTATDSEGAIGSESVGITVIAGSAPVLSVYPTLLDFGSSGIEMTFQITKTGDNILYWTVSEYETWIGCSSGSGNTSGDGSYSGTGDETITVTVDRIDLTEGTYEADISITSNGGEALVHVNISVEAETDYPDTNIGTISVGRYPSSIAITPNGSYVYVTNGADDTVSVIQTSDNTIAETINVGDDPRGIAITPNGSYVYVANHLDDTVSVIKTSDNTVVDTIPMGDGPRGIAITPNGGYVYVTNYLGNTVSVIQTSDNTIAETINVGNGPMGIAITPNGSYVYVANYLGDTILVIQTSDNTVADTITAGDGPIGIAITPNGGYVYVTNNGDDTVSVIQTSENTIVNTVSVGNYHYPIGIAITPNGSYVYVTNYLDDTVSVIKTSDNTIAETINVGDGPMGIAAAPNGTHVYVTNGADDTVSVIKTSDNTIAETINVGDDPRGIAITPNGNHVYVANYLDDTVSAIQTSDNTVVDTIPVGDGPRGIAITPNGNHVYVTNYLDDTVSVVQTSDNTVVYTIPVGDGPIGVAITPNGNHVYVANYLDDTVSVVQASDNTVVYTIPVGDGPIGIAITPNGSYVYVTNYLGNTISVIQTSDNTTAETVSVGDFPWNVAITPNGSYVYVTNYLDDTISVIQTSDNTVVDTIYVGDYHVGVAITPNGSYVYTANYYNNTVSVVQTSDNTVVYTIPVGDGPIGIAITPNGSYVYVTNGAGNTVSVIQTS